MKILDLRLLRLTLKTRINSLRFPKSEYFKTGAQVAAFEHRSVMQVLIFLVADVVGSPQLEAIRAYLDWYLCCNAASHTERSLSELQAKSTRRSNKRKVDTQIMKHHEMKLDSISNVATDQGVQTAMQKVGAVRGGAEMVSAMRGGAEMVSAVRGGAEMVSDVRGGAEMVSAVRGGAEM
ncbi:unnamed protein product, partial [Closterium sp. NIES-53]